MGVQFVVDREAKIVRTRFEGFLTYEDLRKHLIEEREQAGLALPEIIDARGITPVLSPLEVRSIVHLMTTLGQNVLGPTAIVIDSFMAFGVVRLAGILAESVGTIAPFWSEEDAEAWIAKELISG